MNGSLLLSVSSQQSLLSPRLLMISYTRSSPSGIIRPHRSPGSSDGNGRWSGCGGFWGAAERDLSPPLGRGGRAKPARRYILQARDRGPLHKEPALLDPPG